MVVKCVLGLSLLVLAATRVQQSSAQNTTTGQCPPDVVISMPTATTVTGITDVRISLGTTVTLPVPEKVGLLLDGVPMGRARQDTSGSNLSWRMVWPTFLTTNGTHSLQAVLKFAGGQCQTQPVTTSVQNPSNVQTASVLEAAVAPAAWSGVTNTSMNFVGNAIVKNGSTVMPQDFKPYMVFEWQTTAGVITPAEFSTYFFSGTTRQSGQLKLKVSYGGKQALANVPIEIFDTTTAPSSSYPSTTTTQGTGAAPSTTTTTQNTSTTPTQSPASVASNTGDPELEKCLVARIGLERYRLILADRSKQTPEDVKQMQACFALRNFVVPRTLAPVAPEEVKSKPETKDVQVEKIENKVVEGGESSAEKLAITFKGKAKPGSVVLLYVYSEPLVLSTTSDSNGEWVYTLTDPMDPGNHEAYAVVDSGDGVYQRSSPLGFIVGKAEASAQNPNGYSLLLEDTGKNTAVSQSTKRQQDMYVMVAAATVVMVVISGLFVTRRVHGHHTSLLVSGHTEVAHKDMVEKAASEDDQA